jgi:AcrR family transcriptional regulator
MAKSGDNTLNSKMLLLEAAKALMEEEGYAAVTSRRIAAKAGLKPQLIHYYFTTMDDLLLELYRKLATEVIELQDDAIRSKTPLRNLWNLLADRKRRILLEQFLIISCFNENIRAEMGELGVKFRDTQIKFIERLLRENAINEFPWSAGFVSILFNALARAIAIEPTYGLNLGNESAMQVVDYYIDKLDGTIPSPEITILRLERENAALKNKLAELAGNSTKA